MERLPDKGPGLPRPAVISQTIGEQFQEWLCWSSDCIYYSFGVKGGLMRV